MKTDLRVILFYFFYAAFSSVFLYLAPLYYLELGFSEAQVGMLAAFFSMAALMQPFFGILADSFVGRKRMLVINLIVVLICTLLLFVCSTFLAIAFIVLVCGCFHQPCFGMVDMFVTGYTEKYMKNYGKFRGANSLGWGIGILICLPFILIGGVSWFLLANMLMITIMLIMIKPIEYPEPHNTAKKETNLKEDIKDLVKNKLFLSLIAFGAMFFGVYRIRTSYQAIKINEINDNPVFIAIITVLMIVPEIILLPHYQKVRNRFSFYQIMTFSLVLAFTSIMLFAFGERLIALMLSVCIHGVMAAFYLPTMIFTVRESVNKSVVVSAFLVYGMALGVFSTIFAMLVVTPTFANFGVSAVFLVIGIEILFALIPLQFIKKLNI